jgi:hypothetical protein
MADRWQQTTGDYSFRFFSPEQVDQILRDGARRGREGSHAAIERIRKHEPGLERAHLWQQIRRLKALSHGPKYRRSVWGPEDEKILRDGYELGWQGKRKAVGELLRRHPDWRPHVIWRRAMKLGLVQRITKRGQERSCQAWSKEDDRLLLDLAGYKTARVIAKMLHRSEVAIRYRLALLGKSSRVHLEGFARSALARELHLSTNAIQRLTVEGLLEVRDPRITRESLDRLCRSGRLEEIRQNGVQVAPRVAQGSDRAWTMSAGNGSATRNSTEHVVTSGKLSRAKRVWAEVATSLSVTVEIVGKLIARGILKLYDPRITEKSLRNFCRRHGALINSDVLNRETRDWLQTTMDFLPHAGEAVALCLTPLRKHARVVRRCTKCGRTIRGNVFFRHDQRCKGVKSESTHIQAFGKPAPRLAE